MSLTLKIVIAPQAAEQIRSAARWWSQNRPLAPDAIRVDLKAGLDLLAVQPQIGSSCDDSPIPELRRLLLGRVQYFIYYQRQSDVLRVLAFWHTSRVVSPVIKP